MKECPSKKVLVGKVAQNDPFDLAKKIVQVDSEIKELGYSYMFKKKFINQPQNFRRRAVGYQE